MTRREAETLQRLLAETPPAGTASHHAPGEGGGELVGLASLARSLEASAAQPSPSSKTALRQRILALAAEDPPAAQPTRVGTLAEDLAAAWRYAMRSAVPSAALTVLLLLAGVFVGASLSLPGDPLYTIKDAYQKAQLARASAPADIATVQLRLAEAKVEETVRAAERQRLDSLAASADDADDLVRDSADTLLAAYHDSGDAALLAPLAEFVDDHEATVADVRQRVEGSEAERPLARLMGTLRRVEGQVDGIRRSRPAPGGDTGFWTISSPNPSLDDCPCLLDDGEPAAGEAPGAGGAGLDQVLQPAPRNGPGEGSGAPGPAQRWRERVRDGVEETRQRVDDATDGVIDTVDGVTDGATDAVDETTDEATDTLDDATGGGTDGLTDGLDDTLDRTTDAVDDTVDGTTDAVDRTLDGALGGGSGSPDGSADANAAPRDEQPAGDADEPDAGSGADRDSDDADASGDGSGASGDSDAGDGGSEASQGAGDADSGDADDDGIVRDLLD